MEVIGDSFVLPYPCGDNMFFCNNANEEEELHNLAQRVDVLGHHDDQVLDSYDNGGSSYDCYFSQMPIMDHTDFFVPDDLLCIDEILKSSSSELEEEEGPLPPPPDHHHEVVPPDHHHEVVSHVAAAKKSQPRKRKSAAAKSSESNVAGNPKNKKPCVSRNTEQNKSKKRKQKKIGSSQGNFDEEARQLEAGQSSEEDSSHGKAKAKATSSRGTATDPQSLYARKRRERINERLRILQNIVPNGTKVDISTMLEEAVHYVKFLQLQIKLLSSDNTWMYAPIAYNGMDIGLSQILHLQPH